MKSIVSLLVFLAMPASAFAASMTYSKLIAILQDSSRHIRSIDDLLGQPEFSSEYRAGFTMMYKSRSLQYADPMNPRVILYGEDSKLIMAMTCAPGDCIGRSGPVRRETSLEIIHWEDATKSFEFRSVEFPESDVSGSVVISEANPKLCMGCHMGPDPRPNWEPYPTWQGAYGGNDDHLYGNLLSDESRQQLDQFLSTAERRPRYRHLVNLVSGYQDDGARDKKQHNIDFTETVTHLNIERILTRLPLSQYYQDLKYPIYLHTKGMFFDLQLKNAGFGELADLMQHCIHPMYSGAAPEFPSVTSTIIRLYHALGEPSLPWFLSFEPNVKSEMVSPWGKRQRFSRCLRGL